MTVLENCSRNMLCDVLTCDLIERDNILNRTVLVLITLMLIFFKGYFSLFHCRSCCFSLAMKVSFIENDYNRSFSGKELLCFSFMPGKGQLSMKTFNRPVTVQSLWFFKKKKDPGVKLFPMLSPI